MDQNPLDNFIRNVHDLEPLYDENPQQANETEFNRPNADNNQDFPELNFQGTLGRSVNLVTNNFQLFFEQDWKLQKYEINFNPNVETSIKKEILNKHKSFLGEYVLDGNTMYSFVKYIPKKFSIYDNNGSSGLLVTTNINHISEVKGCDVTTVILEFVHTCLQNVQLIRAGSDYYDPKAITINKRLGVKCWSSYLPRVRKCYDNLVIMNIELSNKLSTAETVLDFLNMSCGNNRNKFPCLMKNFKAIIIGTVVLTLFNNKLYKIQAVDENLNIYSTFINEDGLKISYRDYYLQKWNIIILDDKQPLLKTTDHDDVTLYLVPELCTLTGFTDIIRKKHLVKELNQYTNYGPKKTVHKYNQFLNKLIYTPKFLEALNSWNMSVGETLIKVPGRVLSPMNLKCLNNNIFVGDQGNWTDQLRQLKMLETPYIEDWVVLAPSKYFSNVKKFVITLRLTAERMALHLPEPEIIQINDVSQSSYMSHLDVILNRNIGFILCVIKSLNSDLYNEINRKLCLEAGVPSQLLSLKQVITNDLSMHTKTVIRINCKLGGVPWSIEDMDNENVMVVGLDNYQDSLNKHKYFCASMVSMNGSFTRYYSYVELLCKEDISEFYVSTVLNALCKYNDLNRQLPRRILIYRDGLKFDDKSSKTCIYESNLMLEKCSELYCNKQIPFAYILVRKYNETKFFTQCDQLNYRNPLPGTIVDSNITDPNIFDFFLISHSVKSGPALPTYYRILFNSIPELLIDEVHMITYLLTHMYYKSSHTIRVPAPCKLAYDLAYFCANTLKSTENIFLHGYPFFF